jgi:hypothetical protein
VSKSKLVPVGNVNSVEGLASTLGCRVLSLPMKYLCFRWEFCLGPNLYGMLSLAGWLRKYLSKGREVTMGLFLWGGICEEFKFHLVSWSKVCSLVPKRGLEVRYLLLFNRAFLG